MKLYHGTSKEAAEAILKNGLKPRGKAKGNWDHTVTSNPKAVYLTDCYAWHFAASATKSIVNDEMVILEIESDKLIPWKLAPDEDFLEQVTRNPDTLKSQPEVARALVGLDMKQRTLYFRKRALTHYQHMWEGSLKHMGTCGYYDTIPVAAIERVSYFQPKSNRHVWMSLVDCSVSVIAHTILRHKYVAMTKWLFGEDVTVDDFTGGFTQIMPPEAVAEWENALKNRSGLRVEKVGS